MASNVRAEAGGAGGQGLDDRRRRRADPRGGDGRGQRGWDIARPMGGAGVEEGAGGRFEPGVPLEEIEARRRQAVADAVQPVQEANARIELATAPSSPDIRLLRERLRQRQGW